MKKIIIPIFVLISFVNILSQPKYSIQVNGGLLYPNGADDGLTTSVQLNYRLKESGYIYFNAGINNWDKNIISLATADKKYTSYSEDEHFSISFYTGYHFIFKTVKTFKIFINSEIGYNYLRYDSYKNIIHILENDEEHKTNYIFGVDPSSRKRISKSLFGVGLSTGVKNMMTENFGLSIELKMNNLFYTIKNIRTQYALVAGFIFGL